MVKESYAPLKRAPDKDGCADGFRRHFGGGVGFCIRFAVVSCDDDFGRGFSVLMCGMPSERRFRRHSGHFCAVRRSNMPPSAK